MADEVEEASPDAKPWLAFDVLFPCLMAQLILWSCIALNYWHLAVLRQQSWPVSVYAGGYMLLLFQIASFLLCVLIPPGSPPVEWFEAAARGEVERDDSQTESCVPPRSQYVKRHGGIVLHIDHYCWFLGTAVGLKNRKFFVLFLVYSLMLVIFALGLDLIDARDFGSHLHHGIVEKPWRTRSRAQPPVLRDGGRRREYGEDIGFRLDVISSPAYFFELVSEALYVSFAAMDFRLGLWYRRGLMAALPTNLAIAFALAEMAGEQIWLVLRGRTTIRQYDETYDLDWRTNTRIVMGDRAALWWLPWPGTGTTHDGLTWRRAPERGLSTVAKSV